MTLSIDRFARVAPSLRADWWVLRLGLIVGYGFMEHGYAKLARGPDAFAGLLEAMHTPFAVTLAWATILTELIGGLALFVRRFHSLGKRADDHRPPRRDRHRSPSLRVQLDKAAGDHGPRRAVRTAGVRD